MKQSHPVGFSEHINLDYIYLLETSAYKVYVSSCMGGWPQGPGQAFSLWSSAGGRYKVRRLPCHPDWVRPLGMPPGEEIPHSLLWLSQCQQLPWERSVWEPPSVALTKVGGGGWAGEGPETSLRVREEPSVACGPSGSGCCSDFSRSVKLLGGNSTQTSPGPVSKPHLTCASYGVLWACQLL